MDRRQRRREKKRHARRERIRRQKTSVRPSPREDDEDVEIAAEDLADEAVNVSPYLWPSKIRHARTIVALASIERDLSAPWAMEPRNDSASIADSEIDELQQRLVEQIGDARGQEISYAELLIPSVPEDQATLHARIELLETCVERWGRIINERSVATSGDAPFGDSKTRSLLRTRMALADAFEHADRNDNAVNQYSLVLESDPEDHLGARGRLIGLHLADGDIARAEAVLDRLPEKQSALALWGRVLARFVAGDRPDARRALHRARRFQSRIEEMLVPIDERSDDDERRTTTRDVIEFVAFLGVAWKRHPAITRWLGDGACATTAEERGRAPQSYSPPVSSLLDIGEVSLGREWFDYTGMFRLSKAEAPELIRMACDPALHEAGRDEAQVWSPLHAWRALAQLGAEEAAEPLARMLCDHPDDDWLNEDMPRVFARFGRVGREVASTVLGDPDVDEWSKVTAVVALRHIAQAHPAERDAVVGVLASELAAFETNGRLINAELICELTTLGAREHAPLVRRAFESGRVDQTLSGSWDDIRSELFV